MLEYKGFEYKSISSNGVRFYELNALTDEAKDLKQYEEDKNEYPF